MDQRLITFHVRDALGIAIKAQTAIDEAQATLDRAVERIASLQLACQHDFHTSEIAIPADSCNKCGMYASVYVELKAAGKLGTQGKDVFNPVQLTTESLQAATELADSVAKQYVGALAAKPLR